mmetsp:Transcript_16820/g.27357  ORF Transcript_16820/g.27357 Transcript_16820/m.27357 type:complete len:99 (+) Transcript_16820:553-849(+)
MAKETFIKDPKYSERSSKDIIIFFSSSSSSSFRSRRLKISKAARILVELVPWQRKLMPANILRIFTRGGGGGGGAVFSQASGLPLHVNKLQTRFCRAT